MSSINKTKYNLQPQNVCTLKKLEQTNNNTKQEEPKEITQVSSSKVNTRRKTWKRESCEYKSEIVTRNGIFATKSQSLNSYTGVAGFIFHVLKVPCP